MQPLTETLYYLLGEEINNKYKRAAKSIIKSANFPFRKTIEDYNISFQKSVNKKQIHKSYNLGFIEEHEKIVL